MGGWTLRNGWLIKSSYVLLNELYACQLTETKVRKKSHKNKCSNGLAYLAVRLFHDLLLRHDVLLLARLNDLKEIINLG
jgi:hypothetical protein